MPPEINFYVGVVNMIIVRALAVNFVIKMAVKIGNAIKLMS